MRYEDFTVEMWPSQDRIRVKASCSLGGEADGYFSLPPGPDWCYSPLAWVTQEATHRALLPSDASSAFQYSPQVIGEILFEALFQGSVRRIFERSLGSIEQSRGLGLRIKLKLDLSDLGQARLHALPWELLYNADTAEYLSLSQSRLTPVVRYLEVSRPSSPKPLPATLRILALAAQPDNQAPLDLATEQQSLQVLQEQVDRIEVEFLESVDMETLRRALVRLEPHVLHFMGHGAFDPDSGRGILLFERGDGRGETVSASLLAVKLIDCVNLRLVVLNACSTACSDLSSGINSFSGLATALVRGGVPAVIAMQASVSDRAAVKFSEIFYRRLCEGDPVDTAVSEGRQGIHTSLPYTCEWAIPALFMRVPDGVLFPNARRRRKLVVDRSKGPWVGHLQAQNYVDAIRSLRSRLARNPEDRCVSVALGIALGSGRRVAELNYQTAKEMHRLFIAGLSNRESQALAVAALVALKLDYFRRNSVQEPPPLLEELLRAFPKVPLSVDDVSLLNTLRISERSRRVLRKETLLAE